MTHAHYSDTPEAGGAREIVHVLRDAGYTAFLAGGCVRDMLMARPPQDYDIATDAPPAEVARILPQGQQVGKAFAVTTVRLGLFDYDVATFRRDLDYSDGRRPDAVEFATAAEDAKRRDFTINGMFYDPLDERLIDYVGGEQDLRTRLIRTIGDPAARFAEDHLRLLRAVRFSSTLGFSLETQTEEAIRHLASHLKTVSSERVQNELTRLLLESPLAGQGVHLLLTTGLLEVILPEVAAMYGQAQPPEFHPEGDVFTHTTLMLDAMANPDLTLAYAVLLHDVGKPPTARMGPDRRGSERLRFDGHAKVGAEIAATVLQRLRLPKRIVNDVTYIIESHMRFLDIKNMKESTLRRMIAAPTFEDELELHRLDCLCSHGDLENYDHVAAFRERIRDEKPLPPPWVKGDDVLAMGISPGPLVGTILHEAYDRQMNGAASSREELLEWTQDEVRRRTHPGA